MSGEKKNDSSTTIVESSSSRRSMKIRLMSTKRKLYEVRDDVSMECFTRIKDVLLNDDDNNNNNNNKKDVSITGEEKQQRMILVPVPKEDSLQLVRDEVSRGFIIPIPIENDIIFENVIGYCTNHVDKKLDASWEATIKDSDKDTLARMMLVAYMLGIDKLLKLIARTLAEKYILGKNLDEILQVFPFFKHIIPEPDPYDAIFEDAFSRLLNT